MSNCLHKCNSLSATTEDYADGALLTPTGTQTVNYKVEGCERRRSAGDRQDQC